MKERPILFSALMVRAILDGSKTQTRRVVHNPHRNDGGFVLQDYGKGFWPYRSHDGESGCYLDRQKDGDYYSEAPLRCPYGQPGDRLWVRETWAAPHSEDGRPPRAIQCDQMRIHYLASEGRGGLVWRPSIHMPRWASRITLEITGVRVERLWEISEADAIAEGIGSITVSDGGESRWVNYNQPESKGCSFGDARSSYRSLWDEINGQGSWDANPWVWVVEFERLEAA
jgi:hypothetical protein